MKKINLLPFLITSSLTLAACEGIPIGKVDNSHDETLIVLNHKAECKLFNAANSTLCLKVNYKDNDNSFLLEKNDIKGFSYEWGFDYELEVEVEDLINPPQDSPSEKYTFKKENKKDAASTVNNAFEISISSKTTGSYIKKVSGKDNTYKIFDDKEVTCLPDVCAELDQLVADDKAILMEFKHQSPSSKPLELIKIKCNDIRANFIEKCLNN